MNLFDLNIVDKPISPVEISKIGVQEKFVRKEHYNSLKVWWARRPIQSVRALIINEILNLNKDNIEFNRELFYDLNPSQDIFNNFIEKYSTNNYSLLDVFSGGGSIPFESARLGLKTYSSELNPIAYLAQKTIFDSLRIPNYSKILKEIGNSIINKLEKELAFLFDVKDKNLYVIFWGRSIKCSKCGNDVNLGRLDYLSKRKKRIVRYDSDKNEIFINPNNEYSSSKIKNFVCQHCKKEYTFKDIKEYCRNNKLEHKPLVLCYYERNIKHYIAADDKIKNYFDNLNNIIDSKLSALNHLIPNDKIDARHGVINPTLYDMKSSKDFFNRRQLLILVTLIDLIIKEYESFSLKYDNNVSQQILLGLTPLLEFLIDWNNVSTMWISQNEQTGRSLAGPGVGMKWDYIELNPFFHKGSNLKSKLNRVISTLEKISLNNDVNIFNTSSTNLPIDNNSIDFVVTDPPYFDSIDYTGLSEFFRGWFEILIRNTYNENISLQNDIGKEAIVELAKSKKNKRDSSHYEEIMTDVLKECNRVLKDEGKLLLMYSHKTLEGWEIISNTFRNSKFYIEEVIPLDMERKARPRGMTSEALNGVIIFRLSKINHNNYDLEKDIRDLKDKLLSKEISEENVIIYLAGLTCKYHIVSNRTFQEQYNTVKDIYFENNSILNELDELSQIYLSAYHHTDILPDNELILLREHDLLNSENKIKRINEIESENLKNISPALYEVVRLYNNYKYHTTTRIFIDENLREMVKKIYRHISGVGLNTLSKRSSQEDIKISRKILHKIQ